jgi:hypothetical protein
MPIVPAFRLSAPIVRFISFDISATGVLRLEWAFKSRMSTFVQGLATRRATLFAIWRSPLRFAFYHRGERRMLSYLLSLMSQ